MSDFPAPEELEAKYHTHRIAQEKERLKQLEPQKAWEEYMRLCSPHVTSILQEIGQRYVHKIRWHVVEKTKTIRRELYDSMVDKSYRHSWLVETAYIEQYPGGKYNPYPNKPVPFFEIFTDFDIETKTWDTFNSLGEFVLTSGNILDDIQNIRKASIKAFEAGKYGQIYMRSKGILFTAKRYYMKTLEGEVVIHATNRDYSEW